jgi:hypothetical protein
MRKLRILVIMGLMACWAPVPCHAQVSVQRGGGETWYQGHPGRWHQENKQWRWRNADDNNEYYQDHNQYRWRSPYTPYKFRNPQADRQNYQQYQETHPGAH